MENKIFPFRWIGSPIFVLLWFASVGNICAIDQVYAVKLCRDYLASEDETVRNQFAVKLAEYRGEIQPVLDELSRQSFEPVKTGYLPARHFSVEPLNRKHPEDLLYFTVPKSYQPQQATGLIVFMHGGGKTSSRKAPRVFMNFPEPGDEDSNQLGDLFEATGMIAVGPSALWNQNSSARWCVQDSDEYLSDVITECKTRFNIDPDRVFLVGHSMGGFGAYHHAQRQPDRFAAVIVSAGSWSSAYLPMLRGTPLCIIQGVNDARPGERWHYTDVEYARWTDKLLAAKQIEHTYFEHEGKHGVRFGREYLAKFLQMSQHFRRDVCYPHVALASPVGYSRTCSFPVKHNRWLTLHEVTKGEIDFDELFTNGSKDFAKWRLDHRMSKQPGAAIDAVNQGNNSITVTAQNVKRFTLWLHPQMVDFAKPVTLLVNGKTRFKDKVTPSLLTALESYQRRTDWGLVYPAKIEVIDE